MRRALKRAVFAGVLAGLAYAIWRAIQTRIPAPAGDEVAWERAPFPFPPVPRPGPVAEHDGEKNARADAVPVDDAPDTDAASGGTWIVPDGDACPASHPVKAKLASGIFHVPGGQNYDRTKPDRCYVDAAAAEADGLRQSKR